MTHTVVEHVGTIGSLIPGGVLDPDVARLHVDAPATVGRGVFRVRRGSLLATRVGDALRLPPAGRAVPVSIRIDRDRRGEVWWRTFGGVHLTTQLARVGSRVVETVGRRELTFDLRADSGALIFTLHRLTVRCGSRRVSLPFRGGLTVRATVAGGPDAGSVHVAVDLVHVLLGRLLSYDGTLHLKEIS